MPDKKNSTLPSKTVTILHQPEKEYPPRRGPTILDITRQEGPIILEHVRFEPGYNEIETDNWSRLIETPTGKQFVELGALKEVQLPIEPPSGEKPEELRNLPLETALGWIHFEKNVELLRFWRGDDQRTEVQFATLQKINSLKAETYHTKIKAF